MDPQRRAVAAELLTASREHDAAQEDRVARYRNLEPESAELLGVLVRVALGLADAAEAVGARLTSVEIDADRTAQARGNLARAGLTADLRTQDAGELLRGADDGGWEFVFLDAEGLLAIDNVISHAEQVESVTALIEAEPTVTTALVPIGAGLRMVVKA